MKKSALIVLLVILSKFGVTAQNAEQTNNGKVPPLKKHNSLTINTTSSSEYNNMDAQIKNTMIDGTIPEDFPKYTFGTTQEKYNAIIAIWMNNNSAKVKPEHRKNSTSTDK